MPGNTLTIPASDLRVGDHIVNIGEVTSVITDEPVFYVEAGHEKLFYGSDRLLTIERHEPEVTERWVTPDESYGFPTYEDAAASAKRSDRPVVKHVWHDGVLRAVEIVRDGHE